MVPYWDVVIISVRCRHGLDVISTSSAAENEPVYFFLVVLVYEVAGVLRATTTSPSVIVGEGWRFSKVRASNEGLLVLYFL